MNSEDHVARYHLAVDLRNQGLDNNALAELRTLLIRDPSHSAGRRMMADLLLQRDLVDEALEHLLAIESVNTARGYTGYERVEIAVILAKRGDGVEALRQLLPLVETQPMTAEPYDRLCELYEQLGNRERAIWWRGKQIDALPNYLPGYLEFALLLISSLQIDDAVLVLQKMLIHLNARKESGQLPLAEQGKLATRARELLSSIESGTRWGGGKGSGAR